MRQRTLQLFDRIMSLRLLAVTLYDRARALKKPAEELAIELSPVTKELHDLIKHRAQTSITDCIEAMSALEETARANQKVAERYLQKAEDDMEHVKYIEEELILRMRAERVMSLAHGDHMVILNVVNGKDHLSYR